MKDKALIIFLCNLCAINGLYDLRKDIIKAIWGQNVRNRDK